MSFLDFLPAIGNAIGAIGDNITDRQNFKQQMRAQKEFAQNAIQWKVADAQKAGIHPLYALGAPTLNYSPISTGGSGWADALGGAGQDISRAMSAGMPREGQETAYEQQIKQLTLEQYGLQNELLASQIMRAKQDVLSKPALPGYYGQGVPRPLTMPGGAKFPTQGQSTAQQVEDRYGDIVQNAYGIGSLAYDLGAAVLRGIRGMSYTRSTRKMGRLPNGQQDIRGIGL